MMADNNDEADCSLLERAAHALQLEGAHHAARTLRAHSVRANTRACTLIASPVFRTVQPLLLLSTPTTSSCVAEIYERAVRMRHDLRTLSHEAYSRLGDLLVFMDAQEEMRSCVYAHRLAEMACDCVCGGGGWRHETDHHGGCRFLLLMSP